MRFHSSTATSRWCRSTSSLCWSSSSCPTSAVWPATPTGSDAPACCRLARSPCDCTRPSSRLPARARRGPIAISSSPTILPVGCGFDRRGRLQRACPWYDSSPRPSDRPKESRRMKLEGSYEVPAPRQTVWDAFLDPARLKQAIPGCEKLEAIGPDEYKATMKVGVGGVKGTFEGKVRLTEKKPPESYKMAVEGSGGPGFIRGETLIKLSDADNGTRVAYSADVQVGGLIASVGQRMLGGVSKMLADKFFRKMSELLQGK